VNKAQSGISAGCEEGQGRSRSDPGGSSPGSVLAVISLIFPTVLFTVFGSSQRVRVGQAQLNTGAPGGLIQSRAGAGLWGAEQTGTGSEFLIGDHGPHDNTGKSGL